MVNDPYTLVIALDKNSEAKGQVYLDDGNSLSFQKGAYSLVKYSFSKNTLTSAKTTGSYDTPNIIEKVVIIGVRQPKRVLLDGKELEFSYNSNVRVVTVRKPNVKINSNWSLVLQ